MGLDLRRGETSGKENWREREREEQEMKRERESERVRKRDRDSERASEMEGFEELSKGG